MENQLGDEEQHRRYFVGSHFGGVIVSCVDGEQGLVLGGITYAELVRTYGVVFQTDTEDFRFETGLHVVVFYGEDFVEALLEEAAIVHTVYRDVLAAVMHPKIHDTGVALAFTHLFGNGTATFGVFNPEITDTFVGIREREVARFGVRERRGVEVELDTQLCGPLHPAFEVSGLALVTVYEFTAEITINLVQVDTVFRRNQRHGLDEVGTHFVDVAGFTGIVTGRLDTAGEGATRLKAYYVIGLPAVQRDLYFLEFLQYFVGIDTHGSVTLLGYLIRIEDKIFFHVFYF